MTPQSTFRVNPFGITGIAVGVLAVLTLYLIAMYGPGSFTTSGQGMVNADGTSSIRVTRDLLSVLSLVAFYLPLLSLLLGLVSLLRRERRLVSWLAVLFGCSPLFFYLLGPLITGAVMLGLPLPIAAVLMYRQATKADR